MCGRARCTLRADDMPRACYVNHRRPLRSLNTDRYHPSYNVAPGSNLPVVRREDGPNTQGVVIHCMKWGLIPSFTKKTEKPDHYKMFNARSESITEKASFRRLVPGSRCLVAVEGFYEWKKDGSKKQPYYVHFKDGRPLVLAALYDSWKNAEGDPSFYLWDGNRILVECVLRRDPLYLHYFDYVFITSFGLVAWMPVILGDKGATEEWLDGLPSSKFSTVLKPYEESDLVWYPVTTEMGKPSFNGPECIKEIHLKAEEMKPISSFFSKKGSSSEDPKPQMTSNFVGPNSATKARLKEEPETQGNLENQSFSDKSSADFTDKSNEDSKSNVTMLAREGATHFQPKRHYEEFSTDEKLCSEITDKKTTPVKKKRNLGVEGDKQQTLFSYFGKG